MKRYAPSAGLRRAGPWLLLYALGSATAILSSYANSALLRRNAEPSRDRSLAGRMLGAGRVALGSRFLVMGDQYFHAGGSGRHDDTHWRRTWARSLRKRLRPQGHIHRDGEAAAEMTPMFWLALRADPHNIEAYEVAAHWLASPVGMNDVARAHEVLREGFARNPRSDRLRLEQALLFLREGRLTAAERALDNALALWPGGRDPDQPEARQTKAYILTYRALLHEHAGQTVDAVRLWRAILEMYPDRREVRARLVGLESGRPSPLPASAAWRHLIGGLDRERSACGHEHGHEHEHEDEHGHENEHEFPGG